ncbi:MAG: nucleotidyl transferase AbiEii/AbiGii toxin family protein [bacterium]|nr:nucleotidyl transferase AbiEii/AbiGii toxin family protein [bacterium]
MVTGSVASMLYGDPRFTHDIDLVLLVDSCDPSIFSREFPAGDFYCPPEEVMLLESRRSSGGHFNLIHHASGFKADIYLRDFRDEFIRWSFANIRSVVLPEVTIPVAPPEYVIVNKLIYYRQGGSEKHLTDIAGILSNMADKVNWEVIQQQALRYGLTAELEKVRNQ